MAHNHPLRISDEPLINFDVHVVHPRAQNARRGRFQAERPRPLWFLTFPSIAFGQRFLAHLENPNARAAAFGPNLKFSLSTIQINHTNERTPKVPHPALVKRLKETAFRDPAEERAQIADAKRSAGSVSLTKLSFGRIVHTQAAQPFSSEFGWSFDARTQANLVFDPESGSLIITIQPSHKEIQTLSIRFKNVLRIEADSPSIILFLSSPPVLHSDANCPDGGIDAMVRALVSPLSFIPIQYNNSSKNSHHDLFFCLQALRMTGAGKKLRLSSFSEAQARVMPFVGRMLRLTCTNYLTPNAPTTVFPR